MKSLCWKPREFTSMDLHADQIEQAGLEAGKTYAYNEQHDPELPAQWWFQDSEVGPVLFVVFFTQACRWSRCLGCNLPSKGSRNHIGFQSLIAQVDHLLNLPEVAARLPEIRKIIISNNGSVLDEDTFSSMALMYLLARIRMLVPGLRVLALETRPEYVDLAELEFLYRALTEGDRQIDLELAIGFEAFDPRIRNEVFRKGLELDEFESVVSDVAPYGFSIKCYFMQKPVPGMSDAEAVEDIRCAIDYLDQLAGRFDIPINMHLNPTYVSSGTLLAKHFAAGEYEPPHLMDVARAALYSKDRQLSVFVGLYDEGLAVPGGSFIREGEEFLVAQLEEFNRTQDYSLLEQMFPAST